MRDPIVSLVGRVAAPAVKGVVEHNAGLELFEVVRIHARQAERGGDEARALRRQIGSGRVDDQAFEPRRIPARRAGTRGLLLVMRVMPVAIMPMVIVVVVVVVAVLVVDVAGYFR